MTVNEKLIEQAKEEIAHEEYLKPWYELSDTACAHEIDRVAQRYHELMMKEVTKF